MTKIFFAALSSLVFPMMAQASYIERCEFQAEVLAPLPLKLLGSAFDPGATQEFALVGKIVAAEDMGSHIRTACESYIGETVTLKLTQAQATQIGETLIKTSHKVIKLGYFYANSRGLDGVVQTENWTF